MKVPRGRIHPFRPLQQFGWCRPAFCSLCGRLGRKMSRIYIDNPIDAGFTRVPNGLWALEISLKAKGLFAFLLSFHHGAAPSVAEIEAALSLGKDARQAAFRELVGEKLAGWRVVRNAAGRAVAKEMWISSRPLLLQALQVALSQEPENPALGDAVIQEPGFPADGFSGALSRKTRLREPENPAISLSNKKNKKGPPVPSRSVVRQSVPVLSPFQRSRILSGQSVIIAGETVLPGSLAMQALAQAVRLQGAENKGGVA
jgi:hypothetical protein